MERTVKKDFMVSGVLFLLFIVFTVIVKNVDVGAIGPEQSTVGLSTINQFVFNMFGVNHLWYSITEWLGYLSIFIAFSFGVLGFVQLIQRKSIRKVNKDILTLGLFYVLMVVFYIFFEVCIVNYRPVIMEEGLEASYPSSHTMISVCIMVTAMMQFHSLLKKRAAVIVLDVVSSVIIALTVIGRLISGVHWLTDIVGGVLLSAALIMLYYSITRYINSLEEKIYMK